MRTTLAITDVAWNSVKPYLPADVVVTAQADYAKAVLATNHALVVLDDGVQAAVEAQSPHPDFGKLITEVIDAVNKVVAVVNDLKGKTVLPASAAPGVQVKPLELRGFEDMELSLKLTQRTRLNVK